MNNNRSIQQPRDVIYLKYMTRLKAYNLSHKTDLNLEQYLELIGKNILIFEDEIKNFNRFEFYKLNAIYKNNKRVKRCVTKDELMTVEHYENQIKQLKAKLESAHQIHESTLAQLREERFKRMDKERELNDLKLKIKCQNKQ